MPQIMNKAPLARSDLIYKRDKQEAVNTDGTSKKHAYTAPYKGQEQDNGRGWPALDRPSGKAGHSFRG